ncbi:hypothetical protein AUK57_02255 [Candidatus Saccharibacteria bacterium CG2_30_41_52]|nr:MAG: hypothetical protein AUK57_02255 [Candidatus Saccharibacteria bacterium CG2_30_41_52]
MISVDKKSSSGSASVKLLGLFLLILFIVLVVELMMLINKNKETPSPQEKAFIQKEETVESIGGNRKNKPPLNITYIPLNESTQAISSDTRYLTAEEINNSKPITFGQGGKIDFTVSGKNLPGPKVTSGYFDPYDPTIGQKQKIGLKMTSESGVQKSILKVETDSKTIQIEMKMIQGTVNDGVWEGERMVDESYIKKYRFTFLSTDNTGERRVEIYLR